MKNNQYEVGWLTADWPVPPHVHAGTTLRTGGISSSPYNQLNLATHVNDNLQDVRTNRERLTRDLELPTEPIWLNQVHGNNIVHLNSQNYSEATVQTADGSYSTETNTVCVVMTADCLPLLLCNDEGTQIAAIHIGWRGFTQNIITAALDKFSCPNGEIIAWLGPCICAEHYETGTEVHNACLAVFNKSEAAFFPTKPHHWQTNLHKLVSLYLQELGLNKIYGEQRCTYHENDFFFSYRKSTNTGRMASLIWMDDCKDLKKN